MAHPFTPLPEGLLCLPVQLSVQEIAGDRPVHPGEVEGTVGEQQRQFLHRPHSASHRYPDSCKVPHWDPQIQGHSLCWCSGCWGLTHYSVMFWVEECTLDCDLTFYTLILSVIVNLVILVITRDTTISEFFSDGIFHLARSEMCGLRAPFTFGTSQLFWLQLSIIPPGARVRARQTWKEIFVIADEQLYLMRVPDIFWILFFAFCSDIRPSTLWLRGPGRRGALLFWGSGDSPPQPWHPDRRWILGGGAQWTSRRLPFCAGRRSDRERGEQWSGNRRCTGLLMLNDTGETLHIMVSESFQAIHQDANNPNATF